MGRWRLDGTWWADGPGDIPSVTDLRWNGEYFDVPATPSRRDACHLERPLELIEPHYCARCGWVSSSPGGYILHPCGVGFDGIITIVPIYNRVPEATIGVLDWIDWSGRDD